MARTIAELPCGTRITDYISLGVVAKTFPVIAVESALRHSGKASIRQRDLPAHVVVYYVIALALYMQSSYREVLRCLFEGIKWLLGPDAIVKVTGKSGISQARTRLDGSQLDNCTTKLCNRSPWSRRRVLGTRTGVWSVWMEARWILPTRKVTKKLSDGHLPAEEAVPFRNCGSYPWSRTEHTSCSAPAWGAIKPERLPLPRKCCLLCARG